MADTFLCVPLEVLNNSSNQKDSDRKLGRINKYVLVHSQSQWKNVRRHACKDSSNDVELVPNLRRS